MTILARVLYGDVYTSHLEVREKDGNEYAILLPAEDGGFIIAKLDPKQIQLPNSDQPNHANYQGLIEPATHPGVRVSRGYFD